MGTYTDGTPINLVERFWLVDPLTGASTPADPTTVTFTIVSPNGTESSHVSGGPGVSNPFVGVWVCALPPQTPGVYVWRAKGVGAVQATSGDHSFTVVDSALVPVADDLAPGPCQPWITGEDVARCGPDLGVGSDTWKLDNAAADASSLAYELSGRRYPGICTRAVRPCGDGCYGWGSGSASGYSYWGSWAGYGWGWWRSDGARSCGCNPLSEVRLAGYPVRKILQVKIDGVVLPLLDANNNPNYRLDRRRTLVRMADPTAGQRFWPSCQNLDLNDDNLGTFSITYDWGQEPPSLGKAAAAQLARELWLACTPGSGKCALPTKVTKVVRQGLTIDRILSVADMLRAGSSGIQLFDAFIAAANPDKRRRASAVYSPDLQPYARRVG